MITLMHFQVFPLLIFQGIQRSKLRGDAWNKSGWTLSVVEQDIESLCLYIHMHALLYRKWNTGLAQKESWLDWDGLHTQLLFENTLHYVQNMVVIEEIIHTHLLFTKRCENCVNRFINVQWRVTCTPHPYSFPSSSPTNTTHIHTNRWWETSEVMLWLPL